MAAFFGGSHFFCASFYIYFQRVMAAAMPHGISVATSQASELLFLPFLNFSGNFRNSLLAAKAGHPADAATQAVA
jgi:hypothetical protein